MLERSCRENTWWNISNAILHDWLEIVWTVSSTNAKCFMPSCSIRSIWSRKSHCKIWSYWIIHVFHQAWFLLFSYFFEKISFCWAGYWNIFKNHKSFGKVGITKDPRGDGVFTQAEPILIERGGCFGEVALANKCTRTATVVCMEYTELLVIDKEDFDNLKLDRLVLFNFGSQSLTNFQIHSFGAGCPATMLSKYHTNIEFSLCRPSNACSNNPNSILSNQYRY